MSKKFRWFLLAACLFVLAANGREALRALAGGPHVVRPAVPAANSPVAEARERKAPRRTIPATQREPREGELARGERRGD